REAIPTRFLNDKLVWEALLERMPMTAMIRNLGKMTSVGLLESNLDTSTKMVVSRLTNADILKKSRVHPLNVLVAQRMYAQGHGDKGSLKWSPVSAITGALDDAFYGSFGNVERTGKNFFLGVDISGSMASRMMHM